MTNANPADANIRVSFKSNCYPLPSYGELVAALKQVRAQHSSPQGSFVAVFVFGTGEVVVTTENFQHSFAVAPVASADVIMQRYAATDEEHLSRQLRESLEKGRKRG